MGKLQDYTEFLAATLDKRVPRPGWCVRNHARQLWRWVIWYSMYTLFCTSSYGTINFHRFIKPWCSQTWLCDLRFWIFTDLCTSCIFFICVGAGNLDTLW
jgi:hypothetical protein